MDTLRSFIGKDAFPFYPVRPMFLDNICKWWLCAEVIFKCAGRFLWIRIAQGLDVTNILLSFSVVDASYSTLVRAPDW